MTSVQASKPRLLLFAFGDFAFNLYWQSVMLFLLFYYTDALAIPIAVAATTYMVASVWDGIANFAAGVLVDRRHGSLRYGPILTAGGIPLGLTFILIYMPPLGNGALMVACVLGAHLLFRTAYAAVNVPYLAMTARISADPQDRAFVAGMRMLFGTAAAVVVALCTVPVGRWLTGSSASQSYFAAAVLFGYMLTSLYLTQTLAQAIADMHVNRWVLMLLINLFLLVCGFFIPPAAIILMTSPILYPIITAAGFDPVWFGVIMTINMEIGLIHPPVGLNIYIVQAIAPDVPVTTVMWGTIPYVVCMLLAIVILCIFPEIATWLPDYLMGPVRH